MDKELKEKIWSILSKVEIGIYQYTPEMAMADEKTPSELAVEEILALLSQQKESLLEKLPKEKEVGIKDEGILRIEKALDITGQKIGFNQCRAEIQKIIQES